MSQSLSSNINFYHHLNVLKTFSEAMETSLHLQIPEDWWVVIADVAGSTQAIETGDYKKVNTVGVACIAAVVNVNQSISLPFVFGGDGATFAIPEALCQQVVIALRAAQQLAHESFGLSLRVGLVRVSDLTAQGQAVKLAKVRLSKHVSQPVLSGSGWDVAERAVKGNDDFVLRVNIKDGPAEASFDGFECRWQGVPSFKDHKLSLLVAATSLDAKVNYETYQRVLNQIQLIYGDVKQYHPLRASRMSLSFDLRMLSHEWLVRSWRFGLVSKLKYLGRMIFQNIAGYILFKRNIDTAETQWSKYRDELVENSDYRKFDCMLRMVMDGKESQAEALEKFLQNEFQCKKLVYGMHKSREALVTCIVQSYTGNHMHFVDGSDGGYAIAAKALKKRLLEM